MTTTKQFKTLHSLSDSAFKRLQDKIKLDYPDQMLTRRINSTDWLIVDVALFEQVLRDRSPDLSPDSSEIVQVSNVEVLPPESQSTLQTLFNQTQELTPYKRSETHLNGSQALSIDAIAFITERLNQIDRRNAETRERIDQRKQDNLLMEGLISRLTEIGLSKELEARDLDDEARQLQLEETHLKKQIEALQSKLSV